MGSLSTSVRGGSLESTYKINDVFRDWLQSNFANRGSIRDEFILRYMDSYAKISNQEQNLFSAFEWGGAKPQVKEVFENESALYELAQIAKIMPDTNIRPLWRGSNGYVLAPIHKDDASFLLEEQAKLVGSKEGNRYLVIKGFDSQGNLDSLKDTMEIVSRLIGEGYKIKLEIAIPYSNGKGRDDFDPYPDEFYIDKLRENLDAAIKVYKLSPASLQVSLKDMIGDLNKEDAQRLIPTIVNVIKEYGINKIGLHCHDTGLTIDAYVAAAKILENQGIELNMDAVAEPSGFVGYLELFEAFRKNSINVKVSDEQLAILNDMRGLLEQFKDKYKAALPPETLKPEEFRYYGIPGGGSASFYSAVKGSGIAEKLNLTLNQSLHITGHALQSFSKLAGHILPVTPGFQNKQISAIHMLNKMIEKGYFKENTNYENIINIVDNFAVDARKLDNIENQKNVYDIFSTLPQVVVDFLSLRTPVKLHPTIDKIVKERSHKGEVKPKLPSIIFEINKLREDGKIPEGLSDNELKFSGLIAGPGALTSYAYGNNRFVPEFSPIAFKSREEWDQAKRNGRQLVHQYDNAEEIYGGKGTWAGFLPPSYNNWLVERAKHQGKSVATRSAYDITHLETERLYDSICPSRPNYRLEQVVYISSDLSAQK